MKRHLVYKMNHLWLLCSVVYVINSVQGAPVAKADFWKKLRETNTLVLPRPLGGEDEITIIARTKSGRKNVMVKLIKPDAEGYPDYDNIPCQVNMHFKHAASDTDAININSINDGVPTKELDEGLEPSVLFEDHQFTLTFASNHTKNKIQLFIHRDTSMTNSCELTEGITFITVEGDVERVENLELKLGS